MRELGRGGITSRAVCIRSLHIQGHPGTIWSPTVARGSRISNAKLDGALDRLGLRTRGLVTPQLRRPTCHPQGWDNLRNKGGPECTHEFKVHVMPAWECQAGTWSTSPEFLERQSMWRQGRQGQEERRWSEEFQEYQRTPPSAQATRDRLDLAYVVGQQLRRK